MRQPLDFMKEPTTATPVVRFGSASADYLDRLAAELEVPPSRYEEAKNRYQSVGAWLDRDESTMRAYSPRVYVQGSFRLGTPIRPVSDSEHYDIDLVCELSIGKDQVTQKQLKEMLGHEMQLYAEAHGMKDVQESRRCWTLEYADSAQFHLDALPAIPDAEGQRVRLQARALSSEWSDTAIAITDTEHAEYERLHRVWPHSNPRGFTEWFRSRMREVFNARRGAMALEAKASVEDIPSYTVKTPLQQAVQILKRHRDLMFLDDPDNKPISVILTTLAGRCYRGESTVALALETILREMDAHITYDAAGNAVILNPTDPSENFADKWVDHPARRKALFAWLTQARRDLAELSQQTAVERLVESGAKVVGEPCARSAARGGARPLSLATLLPRLFATRTAAHRKVAPWPYVQQGSVSIAEATWTANGFSRPVRFTSDSAPLRKRANLVFKARTNLQAPYDVYWQVVNTGAEAEAARCLRGGFDVGTVERGSIVRRESTLYAGSHSIECFVVKNGFLVARSGLFIVNIR